MDKKQNTLVDFIARGASADEWRMVLVEEGPWQHPFQAHLQRLQERLYGCIDAVIDGQLAEKFPESDGQKISIELDCYDLPEAEVYGFFKKFTAGVLELPDYRIALEKSPFVKELTFTITFDNVH